MNIIPHNDEVQKKIHLAMNLDTCSFSAISLYKLQVGEVKIELLYRGDYSKEIIDFLEEYFKNFLTFVGLPDVSIHYWQLPGIFGNTHWKMWNDWPHELDFIKGVDQFDILIERDFVAKVHKNGSQIYAHGPIWSFATCDSIDNIISYALGRHLIKYNGLILHAACVVQNDEAFVFFGASGAGKSTLAEHCYKVNGLKVISSDQVIIKYFNQKLYAQVMPTTIPEFHLNHPAREVSPKVVKCLLHLVQGDDLFSFCNLEQSDWLKYFMRELVFRNEFSSGQDILDLSLKISSDSTIIKGEMSYQLGSDFLKSLKNVISEQVK